MKYPFVHAPEVVQFYNCKCGVVTPGLRLIYNVITVKSYLSLIISFTEQFMIILLTMPGLRPGGCHDSRKWQQIRPSCKSNLYVSRMSSILKALNAICLHTSREENKHSTFSFRDGNISLFHCPIQIISNKNAMRLFHCDGW